MITIQEKLIFRSIKKSAIVWLLMLRLDPQPLTQSMLSEILAIDRRSARNYLKALNELHIITRLGYKSGYQLTESGKQLTLPVELGRISPHEPINVNESNQEIKDLKDSLLLIKPTGENLPSYGEKIPTSEPSVDKTGKSVDKLGINEMIDLILEKEPERREILDELLNCRIQINHRTINLLTAEDITAQEIKSQYHQLEIREMENQTGILITNLESKYRPRGADFDPDTGHPAECSCYKCIGARNKRFFDTWGKDPDIKYQKWESDE